MSDICLLLISLLNPKIADLPSSLSEQRALYCENPQKTPGVQQPATSALEDDLAQAKFATMTPRLTLSVASAEEGLLAHPSDSQWRASLDVRGSSWSSASLSGLMLKPLVSPRSGAQLYQQRLIALQAGTLYSRLSEESYYHAWKQASKPPTHQQWQQLLALEAGAIAQGQGQNRLNVMLGDSLLLWFPSHLLPKHELWLNQSISGENTSQILQRLSAFAQTRPDTIYIMAGINDLRHGATDGQILSNLQTMIRRLQQNHPQARIVVQSILPTRWASLPSVRIQHLNRLIRQTAQRERAVYLDLFDDFLGDEGMLHRDLTTDGLHLSYKGYQVWHAALGRSGL